MPNPARPTKLHPETPQGRWQTAGAKNYFFALLVADFCCCFCLFVFWVFFGLLSPTCCLLLFAIRLDYRPVPRPLSRDATKVSPR